MTLRDAVALGLFVAALATIVGPFVLYRGTKFIVLAYMDAKLQWIQQRRLQKGVRRNGHHEQEEEQVQDQAFKRKGMGQGD